MLTYEKILDYLSPYTKPSKKGKKKQKTSHVKKHDKQTVYAIFLYSAIFIGAVIVIGLIGLAVMVVAYSKQLPPPGKPFQNNQQDTIIYASDGTTILASIHPNDISRKWVGIAGIDTNMRYAMISAEDINFYSEPGVDVLGILKAGFRDVFHLSGGLQGGSSITQQLVKTTELSADRTFQRKIKELILTLQVEKQYSKDQILEAYLNQIPFGGTISGIKVASEQYFNVEPDKLDLAQSAFLAGIPQAPSYYSPLVTGGDQVLPDGMHAADERAFYVLDQMVKHSNITHVTQAQVDAAKKEILGFTFSAQTISSDYKAPDFVNYVKSVLENLYGSSRVLNGGFQVYTTLDYNMQQEAQDEINNEYCSLNYAYDTGAKKNTTSFSIPQADGSIKQVVDPYCQSAVQKYKFNFNGDDAAMVSIDARSGEIKAMVGSPQGDTDVNIVTDPSGVQPGSSIKPLLYLSAFKNLGLSPTTIMPDVPMTITPKEAGAPPYSPVNFSGGFQGIGSSGHPMNIDSALSQSLNVPAVETLYTLGLDKFLSTLNDFGYSSIKTANNLANAGLGYAIGSENVTFLEHVNAYATIANGGTLYPATAVLKITDSTGRLLYSYDPSSTGKRVIDEAYPYMMNKTLEHYQYLVTNPSGVYKKLTGSGFDIAGKTGTNNTTSASGQEGNASSITFVGYTPDLVSGFWFGNQQYKSKAMASYHGLPPEGEYLIPFWGDYMQKVLPQYPKDAFQRPGDVVNAKVCSDTGLLYVDGKTQCNAITGLFQKDSLPKQDDEHVTAQVCPNDHTKLASPAMVAAGQGVSQTFVTYKTIDPYFQKPLDDYLKNTDQLPTAYCDGTQGLSASITAPTDQSTYSAGSSVQVSAIAETTTPNATISSVLVFLNNVQQGSLNADSQGQYSGSFTIPANEPNGSYNLQLRATDSTGAVVTSNIVSLIISAGGAPPSQNSSNITIVSPAAGSVITPAPNQTPLKLSINSSVPMSNISAVYFDVYSGNAHLNSNPIMASQSGSLWAATYAFPVATAGSGYTIYGCANITTQPTTPICNTVTVLP